MNHLSRTRSLLIAAAVATAFAAPPRAQNDVASIWKDPVFQRQFVAGYGVDADVEPRVTEDEVATLEEIRPLMEKNELAKARAALEREITPKCSAMLDFTLGGILFQMDLVNESLAANERAVAKYPSFRRAWRNIGFTNARLGNHDQTIRAFTRMIELGGADAYSYGLLGFAHSAKQDFQPAEAAFRTALLLQPDNTQWRLGLTQCVLKQQKFEDAASLLDVLIAQKPDKSEFWLLQAHAFLGMKQPLRAAENLEVVDRLGKATVDSAFTLGDIWLGESLPDLALRAYVHAIDLDGKQPVARPMRAAEALSARSALPQAKELVAHMRTAMDKTLADADKRKLLKLEARFRLAEGSDSEADVQVLEEIVKLDPLDGDALMMIGKHHVRAGAPDRAMLYFERAANVEAFEAEAKIRQAQVLVGLKRYGEALPLLRRAQQIRPRDEVARYVEQVERISRTQR